MKNSYMEVDCDQTEHNQKELFNCIKKLSTQLSGKYYPPYLVVNKGSERFFNYSFIGNFSFESEAMKQTPQKSTRPAKNTVNDMFLTGPSITMVAGSGFEPLTFGL